MKVVCGLRSCGQLLCDGTRICEIRSQVIMWMVMKVVCSVAAASYLPVIGTRPGLSNYALLS